jgi:hypothetical protein
MSCPLEYELFGFHDCCYLVGRTIMVFDIICPQIVAKPSEITPLTANALAEIIHEVGLPRGVFNLVHGYGADVGSPLYEYRSSSRPFPLHISWSMAYYPIMTMVFVILS